MTPANELAGLKSAPGLAEPSAHVMIVDDEPENLRFLNKFLASLGYAVTLVSSGEEALERIRRDPPDIVLTDVLMPGMDGLKLCEMIRRDPGTCAIPILMISAQAQLHERLDGFKAGADDYIAKPFDLLELRARLEGLVLRSRRDLWSNPLTHLPGSPGIEADVNRRLAQREAFVFAYIDIDNFKPYNDVYGYHAGDQVIKDLGRLLRDASGENGFRGIFLGHIGGDDFVLVGSAHDAETVLPLVLKNFDLNVPGYYSPEDRQRGGIFTEDRRGRGQFYPFLRLSVGIVDVGKRRITHYARLAAAASEVKRRAKSQNQGRASQCLWDERIKPSADLMPERLDGAGRSPAS